jgi:hypothetical protein
MSSQSYLLETFASLNLLDLQSLISSFCIYQANTGITASNYIRQHSLLQRRSRVWRNVEKMWNGDLSTEDHKRINTRVIGYNGLQTPSHLESEIPLIQIWILTHQHGVTLFLVFLVKIKFISKESFVMPAQQTKNGIPSKQQYFRST